MTFPAVRIIAGLAVALTGYFAYAVVVVPLVEPRTSIRSESDGGASGGAISSSRLVQRETLSQWFPPDAWEIDRPMVLEMPSGWLLFQEYRRLSDDRWKVSPLTVVYFRPDDGAGKARRATDPSKAAADSRPIVLQAPDGAELKFDGPVELGRAEMGKLVGVVVRGTIRIHSPESKPGAGDDLEIHTRNVQIDSERIVSPHDVQFRMGSSYGSGRDLSIELMQSPRRERQGGMAIEGARLLELVHVDKVHLRPQAARGGVPDSSVGDAAPPSPIEITCRGPFRFNFETNVATFEDSVDVIHLNPDGPSDQLNCAMLEVHFERRGKRSVTVAPADSTTPAVSAARASGDGATADPAAPSATNGSIGDSLAIRRIVATGYPVVLRAASRGGVARGVYFEHDVTESRISLYGSRGQVGAVAGTAGEGATGRDPATGRESDRVVELVAWQDSRTPTGAEADDIMASLEFQDVGGFTADEIHVWLAAEGDSTAANADIPLGGSLVPDRMLALGRVTINAPQIGGSTQRLEAWFRRLTTGANDDAGSPDAAGSAGEGSEAPQGAGAGASRAAPRDRRNPLGGKFDVSGNLIRVQLVSVGDQTAVQDISVDGNVVLVESHAAQPDEALRITGDALQAYDASSDRATITVVGRPAHVEARGLTLDVANVWLRRGDNRLWVEGAGQMTLPVNPRDTLTAGTAPPRSDPLAVSRSEPQRVDVTWKGWMDFDGRTIHFERDVVVTGPNQTARGDVLDATLSRLVDFNKPPDASQVELRQVAFRGNVLLESSTYEAGLRKSFDRMSAASLTIDHHTGRLHADGRGWVSSVRLGSGDPLDASAGSRSVQPADNQSEGLTYLYVQFQQAIVGNIHVREMEFIERVKGVYGPVAAWDDWLALDDVKHLGNGGVQFTCDRLAVMEMGLFSQNDQRAVELQAMGNTVVEGNTFLARAERISYASDKQLLVMEGSGRSDAELWRYPPSGGSSHAAAKKILYWRGDNRIEVDDARLLDLSQFGINSPEPQR